MAKDYDKEVIYDERISPLMKQICEICKTENIAMAAYSICKMNVKMMEGLCIPPQLDGGQ